MELPEYCFCGCGERRSKLHTANLEGYPLAMELGRWVTFMSRAKALDLGGDLIEESESFMNDGAIAYRSLVEEVHGGEKAPRKLRKGRNKWVRYSEKLRKEIVKHGFPHDDPFAPIPTPQEICDFAINGKLLEVELSD